MADLEWDDANSEHIALHGVSEVEVEEAVADPQRVRFYAHSGRTGYIGATEGGRILVVILDRFDSTLWRPVTARDASANEKRSYRKRNR